jgi:tryptophan-rich sensory protein
MILNRTDVKGEIANTLAALSAVLAVNALLFGLGMTGGGHYPNVMIEPPGWAVALVWVAIFPMWGLARWHALRAGREGRRLAAFIVLMMGWSLVYPAITGVFDLYKCVACNAISLLLVGFAVIRARSVSRTAMWWMVPSLAWVAFANILTLAKIAAVEM